MAAAPAPSDARVPCPLCGGLIHPIAGRCKHCKADLSRHQAARPASAMPLPSLLVAPSAPSSGPPPSPYAPGAKSVPYAPSTAAEMPAAARTVLPPRPSESSTNVSSWRSWPVVVIVLAMAAIIVAVVLMVWPAKPRDAGTRSRGTEPAPERMQTQPELAPHATTPPQPTMPPAARDPWADDPGPQGSAAPDPDSDQTSVDPAIPDIDDVPAPTARPQGRRPGPGGQSAVIFSMVSRMCRKLAQCGSLDSSVAGLCAGMGRMGAAPPASCPAAERCLSHIDTLPCGMASDDVGMLTTLMAKFQDCADATRC